MSRIKLLTYNILILSFYFSSCTERYNPQINRDFSALVVDGKITNENLPIEIKLFQTISIDSVTTGDSIIPEENATIKVFNDIGESDTFYEMSPGVYQNKSADFKGEIGRSYWIKIETDKGKEYESAPEVMSPTVEITKMYGKEFSKFIDKETKVGAVKFYFDAQDASNETNFIRWEAKESWEWHCPFYANLTDSSSVVCYPTNTITNINVFDASLLGEKRMIQLPITVTTREEQKLLYNYHIQLLVRSISDANYFFWKFIQDINQTSGNLFDKVPGNAVGNVYSLKDENPVVGYFEVSSVSTKGNTFNESMFNMKFDYFPPECLERRSGKTYPDSTYYYVTRSEPLDFDIVYYYTLRKCADCSVEYSPNKPSFWQ